MSYVEPIFAIRGMVSGPPSGVVVQGLGQLEQLLRREFVDDAPDEVKADVEEAVRCLASPAAADEAGQLDAAAYLGVDVSQVSSADLDDETWSNLVWQVCRDGSTWWEDEQTALRIEAASGVGSGLSRVNPALPTGWTLRAVATCGSLDTVRMIDGEVDTWSTIRDLVSDARTRHAQAQVKMHHERYERLRADFELARETRARAVRDALATKVPQERLQAILGVKRAQVYKIAGTTTPSGAVRSSKATGSRPASG